MRLNKMRSLREIYEDTVKNYQKLFVAMYTTSDSLNRAANIYAVSSSVNTWKLQFKGNK